MNSKKESVFDEFGIVSAGQAGDIEKVRLFFSEKNPNLKSMRTEMVDDKKCRLFDLAEDVFFAASRGNQREVMNFLRRKFPEIDMNRFKDCAQHPLLYAIARNDVLLLKELLDYGFSPDGLVYGGRGSALWYADLIQKVECKALLQERGAKSILYFTRDCKIRKE